MRATKLGGECTEYYGMSEWWVIMYALRDLAVLFITKIGI